MRDMIGVMMCRDILLCTGLCSEYDLVAVCFYQMIMLSMYIKHIKLNEELRSDKYCMICHYPP